MAYAENTDVPVERSRAEIERVINRYGASGFMSGWRDSEALVMFEVKARRVKFFLPLPSKDDPKFTQRRINQHTSTTTARAPEDAYKAWEQSCRQRWRALALAIKAKLEAVETGITTFEEEFMAHIVMPDGLTLGERIIPQLTEILTKNKLPPLLPAAH